MVVFSLGTLVAFVVFDYFRCLNLIDFMLRSGVFSSIEYLYNVPVSHVLSFILAFCTVDCSIYMCEIWCIIWIYDRWGFC